MIVDYNESAEQQHSTGYEEFEACDDSLIKVEEMSVDDDRNDGESKENNKVLPDEYEKFVVQYNKTGIKYMQCDKCQFICRPLAHIFEKHYKTHFDRTDIDEKPDIAILEQMTAGSEIVEKIDAITFDCDICKASFPTERALHAHQKIHRARVFSCAICGLIYKTRFELKVHKKTHASQVVSLVCNMCGKSFKTKSGYNHHRTNVCVEYKCEICGDMFLVKSVLQDHLKKVHDIEEDISVGEPEPPPKKEQASSVCPICGKVVTENALSRHLNLHSEDKPYICDLCGKSFRIKWSLREHIMIEIGMKDYVCEICGKKFVIQAYLNKHMRFHMMCEGKFEGFQCEICGKKYAEEWKVKEHQRNSHKGKNLMQYKCDICDKKYARKWLVRSHKRQAHKDHLEEYQCDYCDKKFTEKWIIKLHLQTVHNMNNTTEDGASSPASHKATSDELEKLLEYHQRISCDELKPLKPDDTPADESCEGKSRRKPFSCELCGKMFATKQGMKNHLYAELNMRKYVCEICGKRYNWWMGLKEHSIMNHGAKEFVCDHCGKDFPTKKRCRDHLSVHSDERPYNCKCGNSFKLRRYLAKHQKRCGKAIKKECNENVSKNEIIEESQKMPEPQFVSVPMCELSLPVNIEITYKTTLTDPRIPAEFEKFLRLHTNNIKYMQCDKCDFICRPFMTLFLKHYRKHVDSIENSIFSGYMDELNNEVANEPSSIKPETSSTVGKRFQCGKCTKSFNKRKSFCRHLKIHEKRVFHCNECECKFKTKLAFKAHKERHRRPKELLHCGQCDKYFRSKDGYKYHRENRCILIKCRLCEQQFGQTVDLKEHMKQNHDVAMSDSEQEHQLKAQTSMCFICGKIVKDSNLERHMMIHMEEKPFMCDLCGKSFKSKSAIRDHMMIKLGMKDYVCEICGRKFVKKCYLNKHIRFHAGNKEDQKNLQCDVCSKRFTDKKVYILHKRSSHDPEKPFSCDLCNKSYASKTCLRQHLLREVICVLCDEIFTSNDLLKQHVISVHTLDKYRETVDDENDASPAFVYPCEICGRKFTSEKSYKQHQLTELTCELCSSQFGQNEELKSHIENKHDPTEYRKVMSLRWKKHIKSGGIKTAEYPCNLCGKKLFYRRTLLLHMRMHSGLKPYKCEYCNKAYTSKHSLNAHLISEMNLRKFVCSHCGKRYNFNSDLIVHVKQRHESRQFSCHVCGKKFGLLKYLKDHSTIHSQIKPFNCDKCKLGFRLRKFLIRHNKKYHSGQDEQVFYIEVGADE